MRAVRAVRPVIALSVLAVMLAFAACSEGVTPTCTSDAGCGPKPAADGSTTATP